MGTLVKSLVTLFVFLFNFYHYQVVAVVVVFGVRASPVLLLPSVAFVGCTVVLNSFLEVFA